MTFCMVCQKNLKIKGHNILVFMCIGVRAIFCQGGGRPFAQKILASCPNFYETVEKKRGPYDATTQAALAYEGGSIL